MTKTAVEIALMQAIGIESIERIKNAYAREFADLVALGTNAPFIYVDRPDDGTDLANALQEVVKP